MSNNFGQNSKGMAEIAMFFKIAWFFRIVISVKIAKFCQNFEIHSKLHKSVKMLVQIANWCLRRAFMKKMGKVGLLAQPANPPPTPPPRKLVHLKVKKFMFILHFRLFWAFKFSTHLTHFYTIDTFFQENYYFLEGFKVGTWEPPSITLWIDEILPPHLCSVCFVPFMDSCETNLVLTNFEKKLGFGQPPPPSLKTGTFGKSARFQVPKNGTSSAQSLERTPETPRNTPQNGGVDIWLIHFHFRASTKPIFENYIF